MEHRANRSKNPVKSIQTMLRVVEALRALETAGVTYTIDEGDPVVREATNIRRLTRRLSTITNGKLEQLREADQITLGEFTVLCDRASSVRTAAPSTSSANYVTPERASAGKIPTKTIL